VFSIFSSNRNETLETHQQKISHLRALYHLACADKVFSKAESIYIRNVAIRLGINETELESFDASEPELELPDREYKVYSLFHRLAIIVMIDGAAHKDERRFCFNLGIKMGLHPNAVGEIIDLVSAHGAMDVAPKEIMDIFRKYLS
jgi:hypothetical protein